MITRLIKEDMYNPKYMNQLRNVAKLYKDDIIQHGGEDEDAIFSMIIDIANVAGYNIPQIKNLVSQFTV